jgi:hypothetical protein
MKVKYMFPKAYIFYSIPNANLYLHVRTTNTANVELADYNPYISHNPDVRFMWDVARFQHPQEFFQNVIVVPDIDIKTLTYAHLIKDKEAIYCVSSALALAQLESISEKIDLYGPDYSRINPDPNQPLASLHSYPNLNQDQHELIHNSIHEYFVQSQRSQ